MSGFALGFLAALLTLALVAALRLRRWRRHRARLDGPPGRFVLRRLFRRLGTRPEQEVAITAEADALAAELRALRQDGRALREELSGLVGASHLDEAALAAALEARLARLAEVKARLVAALGRVHGSLDDAQRAALAGLLRHGPAHGNRRC